MKIRIIIERASWRYKLAIGRDPAGTYFAKLTDRGGARVGAIMATQATSAAALINSAPSIYCELAARVDHTDRPVHDSAHPFPQATS